ncbi:MAG: SCO family protein [Proteobacteria bacterium]|nr:MAG: SCO family protein [Pseudomonadota bacterium]
MLNKLLLKASNLIFAVMASVILHVALPNLARADFRVQNQNGEEKDLQRDIIQDGPVIVNFVYTRCEGVCPGQGQRFKMIQSLLEKRSDGEKVKLISISIDPERDSPADLKRWGETYNAGKNWTLLVTDRKSTDLICKEILGMSLSSIEHSPYVAIRDRSGKWQSLYGLSSPKEILKRFDDAQNINPISMRVNHESR